MNFSILYFGGDEHSMAQHDAGNIDHTRIFHEYGGEAERVERRQLDVRVQNNVLEKAQDTRSRAGKIADEILSRR